MKDGVLMIIHIYAKVSLRSLGYSNDELTTHGLRHTASTRMNEIGFGGDFIERQLSHKGNDKIRATYNKATYLEQRTEMMQKWADYLDGLRG